MSESALIVDVTEADLVSEWRLHHDPVAALGVPAHITVLSPFVPPDAIDDSMLEAVAAAVRDVAPFEYDLVAVDEFPGVVWLRPAPDAPFRALTNRLVDAFPGYPPYSGRIAEPQPHLTVAFVDDPAAQPRLGGEIRRAIEPRLPIRCSCRSLSLFVSGDGADWQCVHRFDLVG